MNFIKKIIKKIKLFLLYFLRIVFVKNHFKVPFIKKIWANLNGGFLADQYALYNLKHNSKKNYLSEFDWYRSRYINEPFDKMLNNKVVCAEVLKQYIKTPITYAVKNKGRITSDNDKYTTYQAIINLLKKEKHLIIKPFCKGKGDGVYCFSYIDNQFYIGIDKCTENDIIFLLSNQKNWMLCEFIKQHSYASELYSETTNTIRIITFRDIETKKIRIFFAVQRIGTKSTIPVDNGSKGGLICKVDLDTGILSEARSLHSLDVFKVHPDTQNQIEGVIIPNWEEIKTKILDLANKLSFLEFVAWDVLVTDDDICVIEANASSGINIIQLWGGQRQGELGDFYRYHGVIKK